MDFKLIAIGWVPVHFWGEEILKHLSQCIEAIDSLRFEIQMQDFDSIDDYTRLL